MEFRFINGSTPLSEYDAYLEALDRMNLPEMLKIRQAQYDRYASVAE